MHHRLDCLQAWMCELFSPEIFTSSGSSEGVNLLTHCRSAAHQSSKHARSDPSWLGSVGQRQAGWFLHTGLLPDQIHLAPKPDSLADPNRIRAGFARYDLGERSWVWNWETDSRPVVFQARWFRFTSLLSVQIRLGKTWPSRFDPDQFCVLWSRPSLEEQNQIRCEESDPADVYDPAWFWQHAGHNGHNLP